MKKTVAILALVLAVVSIQAETIFSESFDGTFPPEGWSVFRETNNASATWGRNTATPRPGSTAHARHAAPGFSVTAPAQRTWLISAPIAIPETGSYELVFWSRVGNTGNMGPFGNFSVWISTESNNFADFHPLRIIEKSGNNNVWMNIVASLDGFAGQTVHIAFRYVGRAQLASSTTWDIDDVLVRQTTTCSPISTFPWLANLTTATSQSGLNLFPANCWRVHTQNLNAETWMPGGSLARGGISIEAGGGGVASTPAQRSMFVTPRIAVPEDGTYELSFWSRWLRLSPDGQNERTAILVSTTTNDADAFTYEILDIQSWRSTAWSTWLQSVASLDEFRGQEIYIAFLYEKAGGVIANNWGVSDVQIRPSTPIRFSVTGIAHGNSGTNLGAAVSTGNITIQNQSHDLQMPHLARTFSATLEVNGVIIGTENISTSTQTTNVAAIPIGVNWAVNATRTTPTFPNLRMDLSAPGEHVVRVWLNDYGNLHPGATTVPTDTFRTVIFNNAADLHLVDMYYPITGVGLTDAEHVRVGIRNTGTLNVTNAAIQLWLDGTLRATENLPTIAIGDSISFVFNTRLDLSAFQTHNIEARIAFAGDRVAANDTLRRTVANHQAPFYDVELVNIVAPMSGENLSATSQVVVDVRNHSTSVLTNIPVTYRLYRDYARTELIAYATEYVANLTIDETVRFTFDQRVNLSVLETTNFYLTAFTGFSDDTDLSNDTINITTTSHIYINYFLSNISIPSGNATLREIPADAFPVTVTVNNQGTFALTDFPVHFMVNEGTPVTGRIAELPARSSRQITVNVALDAGQNTIEVFVDENPDNTGTPDRVQTTIFNDVAVNIISFSAPNSGNNLTATESVRVVLENTGTFLMRNVPVSFSIDGFEKATEYIDHVGGWHCSFNVPGIGCATWSPTPRTFTFETRADLSEFRRYQVTVSVDIEGNSAQGSQTREIININPNARNVYPENDAVDVLRDTDVSITFPNRTIAAGTQLAEITITYNDGEGAFTDFVASISGGQLIITHGGFDYETTYTVTIPEGAIVGYNDPIVWTFTTVVEIPGAFALTAPDDDATVLLNQKLTWETSERAASYRVYFGTEPNPTTYTEVTTTSWIPYPALAYDTEYFWRVVAVNAGGETENTTGEQRFMTVFAQLTPDDGAYNVLLTQDLAWEEVEGAENYRVYFGTEPNPTTYAIVDASETLWIPCPALAYYTDYFWRVVAVDMSGEIINTSAERSFTTIIEIPGTFALTVPTIGTPNVLLSQELTWEASERAVSYRVYFGTEPNPTTYTEVTTTSWTPYPALTYSTTYFWRVVAVNAGGETENTAGEWNFTTIVEAPKRFALTAPSARARNVLLSQELTWEASERAVSYRVYFGTEPNPTTYTEVTTTSWTPYSTLAYNTTYFWRVVAVNVGGETSSETWSFTTLPVLVVVSTTPYTDATDITLAANLTVTFNRSIATTSIEDIAIYPEIPDVWFIVSNATLTIAHGGLSSGTFYTVRIPAGTVADYENEITWSFRTREHTATSIDEILDPTVIVIYPNPVDDVLHIQTSELVRRIEIYNAQGVRVIATENITSSIDVSRLPAGVYVIRFITDNGIITQRFVKR